MIFIIYSLSVNCSVISRIILIFYPLSRGLSSTALFGCVAIDTFVLATLPDASRSKGFGNGSVGLRNRSACSLVLMTLCPFHYSPGIDCFRVTWSLHLMTWTYSASSKCLFFEFICCFAFLRQFAHFSSFLSHNSCNGSSLSALKASKLPTDRYPGSCFLSTGSVFKFTVQAELSYFNNLLVNFKYSCTDLKWLKFAWIFVDNHWAKCLSYGYCCLNDPFLWLIHCLYFQSLDIWLRISYNCSDRFIIWNKRTLVIRDFLFACWIFPILIACLFILEQI